MRILVFRIVVPFVALLATACASTTVTLRPEKVSSLCQAPTERMSALVLWSPRWRPDQKDVLLREAAAQQGITRFFATSSCFNQTEVRRFVLESAGRPAQIDRLIASTEPKPDRVLVIVVRELGPIVKLLSSVALVEGGTEVMLEISDYRTRGTEPVREFSVHWQNGGPGIIKGVATLPDDIESALMASLK